MGISPQMLYGISVDFGDLPDYIVKSGILSRFDKSRFIRDTDYIDWKDRYSAFLETVPDNLQTIMLKKAVEYGQKFLESHKKECTSPNCVLEQSLSRRLTLTQKLLQVRSDPAAKSFHKKDKFSQQEETILVQRLDKILEELQTVKNGHEIIYTDLTNEINELKSLFSLGKRNWRQLLTGKLVEMVSSGLISETVSKTIAEEINKGVAILLK